MMRLITPIFLVLGLIPGAVIAQSYPALYDVHNVAETDSLNVRTGPGTSFDVMGTLPHNAKHVEVVRSDDSNRWGLVNIGEGAGWVSLAFVRRHPNQPTGVIAERLQCFGTEPFWDMSITTGSAALSLMGETETHHADLWRTRSAGRSGRMAFGAGDLIGVARMASCNDGMSDREFGIAIDVLVGRGPGTAMMSGCCSLN